MREPHRNADRHHVVCRSSTASNVYAASTLLVEILVDLTLKYISGLARTYAVDTSGNVQVSHTDGLGSVRAITNRDDRISVIETYQTDAFGNPTRTQGGVSQPFQFTGQQGDAESGLYYLRARMYDPTIGRFVSKDPVGGFTLNPLSANRYAYALLNPVLLADPTGLSPTRRASDTGDESGWQTCLDPGSDIFCNGFAFGPGGSLVVGALRDLCAILPLLCPDELGSGGSREIVRPTAESFEQARDAALKELGEIDPATRKAIVGGVGAGEGKIVGFETRPGGVWKRFRIDYDPVKGPHIHVEIGKQGPWRNVVFPWKGTAEDFLKQLSRYQR